VPFLSNGDRRLQRVRAVVWRARAGQSVQCKYRGHDGAAAQPGRAAGNHRRRPGQPVRLRVDPLLAIVDRQSGWNAARTHIQ